MPPKINRLRLLLFFAFTDAAGVMPSAGVGLIAGVTAAWAGATRGNGAPQFEQVELLPGFSVPQREHVTTLGWGGGACINRPDSRALPSFKSAPHWEHVSAV